MIQQIKDNPTDPIGAAVAAIGAILSGFGVWTTIGLTADQVGMVLSGVATLAAVARGVSVSRARGAR